MQTHIFRGTRYTSVLLVMAVILLTTVGSAFANAYQQTAARQGLFGTVISTSQGAFSIRTSPSDTVQLAVTGNTSFQATGKGATFADIVAGERVAVLAESTNNPLAALKVALISSEPQREHQTLAVVDVSGMTVTGEDLQGKRVTVVMDSQISPDLRGQLVTFVGTWNPQSKSFEAQSENMIEQVMDRLETQNLNLYIAWKMEPDAGLRAKREQEFADSKARLETMMQRHLDVLAQVLIKAPAQAQVALEAALYSTISGYRTALEAIGGSPDSINALLSVRTASGTVILYDYSAGKILVVTDTGASLFYTATSDTEIAMGQTEASIYDILPGDRVTIRYNSNSMVASEIRVNTEAQVQGIVQSADTATGEVVFKLYDAFLRTFMVTNAAMIKVNGEDGSLADIKAGATAELKYDPRTFQVTEVQVQTQPAA